MRDLQPELDRRRAAGLYRTRRVAEGPSTPERVVDGRPLINFCSNDYLGLAGHPDLAAALARGACEYGTGAGSAHLVGGHSRAHHRLEEELAEFTGRPRALLFSTGYMANLGVISALAGRSDTVYQDRLNHASLLDGATLARARLRRYPHNDAAALERMLDEHSAGEALVATDGVFSMDGDLAPLRALAEICRPDRFSKPVRSDPPQGARKSAWLMVDDAHGIGVLGARGGGTLEHFGLGMEEVPILMGTLGKALGSFGAFVAGSEELIETLIQQARSYIFTTATPPAIAEATRAALRLVREEPWRRERLGELIQRFRQGAQELGLPLGDSITPIQPIIAGCATRALEWSRYLEQAGFLVPAIRPPTVPKGSARLRVTLSTAHTDEQLERLLEALAGLPMEEKDDNAEDAEERERAQRIADESEA